MKKLPLFQKLLRIFSIIVILGVISTGIITNLTLRSVKQQLPGTLLAELSDLALLLDNLSDTVTASEAFRDHPDDTRLTALKHQTDRLFDGVVALRESYVIDNMVQASDSHAIVAPAVADLQIWIEEGVSELDIQKEITAAIIFERISRAYEKARQVNTESRQLAEDILLEQQVRLSRFMANVNVLFILTGIITCGVLFLLIRQHRLQAGQLKAQSELKEQRDLLSGLFENVDLGITLLGENGDLIFSNKGFFEITGYTAGQIRNLADWFPLAYPDETYRNAVIEDWQKSLTRDNTIRQYQVTCRSGEVKEIEFRAVFLKDKRALVTLSDITWRIEAEKEKIESQKLIEEHKKLSLVGRIAGKMAHDFNNILGIIMGNAEIAQISEDESEIDRILGLIVEQTLRGRNLTRNLIAFAKDQEPRQEFFKIDDKVDLVVNLLRKDLEGIETVIDKPDDMPDLMADPGMIEHMLVNLLQNSIHALSKTRDPKIEIRTCCRENRICLEVRDNGCGIPEDKLDAIYEPSFTLKGARDVLGAYSPGIKGTGYGMSNVKKYVEQHKGDILVQSRQGSGTVFTIRLPLIQKTLTSEEKKEVAEQAVYSGKHILLVEDENSLSAVQYSLLTSEPFHHHVDVADSGRAAIDLLDEKTYDAVSLDYILPGTINGMDVYNHIRQIDKTVPVLFISGNIEFLESIKKLKQGDRFIDHLSKPCRNVDYLKGVNQLLDMAIKNRFELQNKKEKMNDEQ